MFEYFLGILSAATDNLCIFDAISFRLLIVYKVVIAPILSSEPIKAINFIIKTYRKQNIPTVDDNNESKMRIEMDKQTDCINSNSRIKELQIHKCILCSLEVQKHDER